MSAPNSKATILVVDDSASTLELVKRILSVEGFGVLTSQSVKDAVLLLKERLVDLVITDLKMPEIGGLDLVRHVRENCKDTEIMMITGYATIEGAVEAVKAGAEEYVAKPFTDDELLDAVQRSLTKLQAKRSAGEHSKPRNPCYGMLGESEPMLKVYELIARIAATTATVLISGESGTGKELVARAIHYGGPRSAAPFVPVNCGGIPEGLLESELFGHMRGAFTGATTTRAGFFQTADGGTIFLDEISETSLAMQTKLLRVLQEKETYMVGSNRATKVDVRILAATNKDLASLVRQGTFREDLFYRLNVINIVVPPLRTRGTDILLLASAFARKFAEEMGMKPPKLSENAASAFLRYSWPGNVRELQNLIHRLVVMGDGQTIEASDLPDYMRFAVATEKGLTRTLAEVEKEHILLVLESVHGNKTEASRILGIDRKTLREKVK